MAIYKNTTELSKVYKGATELSAVYFGADLIFPIISSLSLFFWGAAGGGGGGQDGSYATLGCGGGGGGSVRDSFNFEGTIQIVVGAGGSSLSQSGGHTTLTSLLGSYTLNGGGGGAGNSSGSAKNGGSGGGGYQGSVGGLGTTGQGRNGGNGVGNGGSGGGGGGITGASVSATEPPFSPQQINGGSGGLFNQYPNSTMDTFGVGEKVSNNWYCSGGGGGRGSSGVGSAQGLGGNGGGANWSTVSANANTGGGGGGIGGGGPFNGGSGFVVLEIPESSFSGQYTGTSSATLISGIWFLVYKSTGTYTV